VGIYKPLKNPAMQNFIRTILPLIMTFFSGCYKFFKREVLPIIHFIEAIKVLIETDLTTLKSKKGKKDIIGFIDWLLDKLGWDRTTLDNFINAFMLAALKLIPDITTANPTFEELLVDYIKYCKTLTGLQLSWLFLKTASLMIIEFSPEKDMKEHQADFLAQTAYTYVKNKKE
jgi:hypothetical protein